MAIAENFNYPFGYFPFCPKKVDVSEYDYWTTLGGTNKDNIDQLTEEEKTNNIKLSLKNAMMYFWNIRRWYLNGLLDYVEVHQFDGTFSGSNQIEDLFVWNDFFDTQTEEDLLPAKRRCLSEILSDKRLGLPPKRFIIVSTCEPVKLYLGAEIESNFIGYGIESSPTSFFEFTCQVLNDRLRCRFASYLNEIDIPEFKKERLKQKINYINMNGVFVVGHAISDSSYDYPVSSYDLTVMDNLIQVKGSVNNGEPSLFRTVNSNALVEINGFEFYKYNK